MEDLKKNINKKSIKELAKLADAEAVAAPEIKFPADADLSEEDKNIIDIIKDTQNPDLSYKLFYGIQSLLKQFLPRGKEYRGLRDYAYELKNILLTQGKQKNDAGIRGGDSRQAYIAAELKLMYDLISDWVKNGATAVDLIVRLQHANDEKGYKYDRAA